MTKRNSNGRKSRGTRRKRQLRNVLIVLLGISLVQYLFTGNVSWPGDIYRQVTGTLQRYATRPEASWRKATEVLEEIGAAREGNPIPAFDLRGRVVRVADGDTVSVLDTSNTQHKVRLYGIDTPERDQPHGTSAKNALARLVQDRQVGVVIVETDEYGRRVGTLYLDEANINEVMVAEGHAWWYRHYAPHEHLLALAEQRARKQRLGLWAGPQPVPPWDWRRGRR